MLKTLSMDMLAFKDMCVSTEAYSFHYLRGLEFCVCVFFVLFFEKETTGTLPDMSAVPFAFGRL